MKKTLAIYLAVFLTVVMMIFFYISVSSYRMQLAENRTFLSEVSAGQLTERIEEGVLRGKSLNSFYGLDEMVRSWAEKNPEVVDVVLLSPRQEKVYYRLSEEKTGKGRRISDEIMLPVYGVSEPENRERLCGYLNPVLSLDDADRQARSKITDFAILAGILLLAGYLAVLICCGTGKVMNRSGLPDKKKILTLMLTSVISMQLIFTGISYCALENSWEEMAGDTAVKVKDMVQEDVSGVLVQGAENRKNRKIQEFDAYAEKFLDKTPILSDISLDAEGKVTAEVSEAYIKENLRRMLLSMITVLAVSVFIAAEIVNYMMVFINRREEKITGKSRYDRLAAVRASSFLIHAACYLPVSFVPAMMNQYTRGTAGDFLLGLPTMVLLVSGLLFTLPAGSWSRKYGWKKVLYAGSALLIVSSLMAALLKSAFALIAARGIYGAAYALIYVAIREFAAIAPDREQRSKGLAQVTAGLYAGINIGAAVGSMICSSIGYGGVFFISALLGGIGMITIKCHLRTEMAGDPQQPAAEKPQRKAIFAVLKSREFAKLAFFIIVPLAVAVLFFDYFLPIYGVKAGVDSADIGRAFLINGIAVAYGVPFVLKRVEKRLSERRKVVTFTALMAAGLLIFGLIGGSAGIYIASFVMGIAEGTALVSQNMIMLELPAAREAGTAQILAIYALIRKLAQAAGPQIFTLFMLLGYEPGMMILGGVMLLMAGIYYVQTGKDEQI